MSRKPLPPRATNSVDRVIAKQIRAIRNEKGIAQEALAAGIGVTFQQVQKYEWAVNRVSASRLFLIAKALGEPVQRFYEGA